MEVSSRRSSNGSSLRDRRATSARLWRETGAEPVSFEDLAMMNAALEELPDEPTSETGDPLQPVGEGDSIDE